MGLFTFVGKVLLAWSFIFSAWKTLRDISDVGVREAFASKLPVHYLVSYSKEKQIDVAMFFVCANAGLNAVAGFALLFDSFINLLAAFALILNLLLSTPVFYDFYRYKVGEPKFFDLCQGFIQNMALVGALLLFMKMNSQIGRRQLKKKIPKSKKSKDA